MEKKFLILQKGKNVVNLKKNKQSQIPKEGDKKKHSIPLWIVLLLISLIIFMFRFISPISFCEVYGISMLPNFKEGELLRVKKIKDIDSVSRYDVVVVKSPDGNIIKRVVGLPGEKIEIAEDGSVYADGILLKDLFQYQNERINGSSKGVFLLDGSSYFVLGDNPNHSLDSREFGSFESKQIYGIVEEKIRSLP